jgi:DNA-binding transcriptional MerR regulator
MAEAVDEKRLYKIGEVCKLADVQPYVLRYWETEFPSLAPNKSGGGQRLYTRGEIDIILRIKQLLYSEGFTIAGAKKKLENDLLEPPPAPLSEPPLSATSRRSRTKAAPRDDQAVKTLGAVKRELTAILELLGK